MPRPGDHLPPLSTLAVALLVPAAIAPAALARAPRPLLPSVPGQSSPVTKIDQGFEDAGILTRSLRHVPIDLRIDDAFQNVYEVKGGPFNTKQFMRTAGGIHAVFPQSDYVDVPGGSRPVTPAGVVYWIGEPPELRARAPINPESDNPASNRVLDQRVYTAVRVEDRDPGLDASTRASAPRPAPLAPRTMEDPAYRITVLARLAEAEKARMNRDDPDADADTP